MWLFTSSVYVRTALQLLESCAVEFTLVRVAFTVLRAVDNKWMNVTTMLYAGVFIYWFVSIGWQTETESDSYKITVNACDEFRHTVGSYCKLFDAVFIRLLSAITSHLIFQPKLCQWKRSHLKQLASRDRPKCKDRLRVPLRNIKKTWIIPILNEVSAPFWGGLTCSATLFNDRLFENFILVVSYEMEFLILHSLRAQILETSTKIIISAERLGRFSTFSHLTRISCFLITNKNFNSIRDRVQKLSKI